MSFLPAVSRKAIKAMCDKTRKRGFRRRTDLELEDIADMYNPVLQGWINYYGRYNRHMLYPVFRHFNKTLVTWAMHKYKKLKSKTKTIKFFNRVVEKKPRLFAHWRIGMLGVFV